MKQIQNYNNSCYNFVQSLGYMIDEHPWPVTGGSKLEGV